MTERATRRAPTCPVAREDRLAEQVVRTGMFGAETSGDTSGYGGLQVRTPALAPLRPYGSYFIPPCCATDRVCGGTRYPPAKTRQ